MAIEVRLLVPDSTTQVTQRLVLPSVSLLVTKPLASTLGYYRYHESCNHAGTWTCAQKFHLSEEMRPEVRDTLNHLVTSAAVSSVQIPRRLEGFSHSVPSSRILTQ